MLSLARCHALLRDAHDYLARQGIEAARHAGLVRELTAWGSTLKRVRVALPTEGRPAIVRDDGAEHSLAEVVNQCATMERLLDALAWAQTAASGLSTFHVVRCHPTTSSISDGVGADHDLVLAGPDGQAAWFKVSDVSGSDQGNHKEKKDLRSLGLLRDGSGPARCDVQWPAARVFLVVSAEFFERLRVRRWRHLTYQGTAFGAGTVLAEALPRSIGRSSA